MVGDAAHDGVDLRELRVAVLALQLGAGQQAVVGAAGQFAHQLAEGAKAPQALELLDAVPVRLRLFMQTEELDAVACALQQGQHLAQLGDAFAAAGQGRVRELDHQVAQRHAAFGQIHADPVVRQARAGEHQLAGAELADPVAHEHLAGRGSDEVQLVLVVVVPARQRRGKAVREAADEARRLWRLVAQLGRALERMLQLGLGLARQCLGGGHGGGSWARWASWERWVAVRACLYCAEAPGWRATNCATRALAPRRAFTRRASPARSPHSTRSAANAATGSAASQMAWATAGSMAWSW